ncbi:MAG: ParB/RepB/Spo0J family partition protein, partial [Erysipelotrichaceae bacterium]
MSKRDDSRLGKGLSAIFGEDISEVLDDIQQGRSEVGSGKLELSVDEIKPNPYQPRKDFDDDRINELSDSIKLHGVFTPILVKRSVIGYELITGERRLRASKLAGKETIPAIIMDFDDQQMMEIALLENIQREDLNAIEEANAYEKLIKKLDYTQEELATRIGKSREHVANMLRLLKLPESIQKYVIHKDLSMGHVRALLSLSSDEEMIEIAKKAIKEKLSVRNVEQLVKQTHQPFHKEIKKEEDAGLTNVKMILQDKLQTQVKIDHKQIMIQYQDVNDLNRILEI